MRRYAKPLGLLVGLGLVAALAAIANWVEASRPARSAAESWKGARVVPRRRLEFRDGPNALDAGQFFQVYRVERAEGDRFLITSELGSGWVPAKSMVPVDYAFYLLARELTVHPDNARAHLYRAWLWLEEKEPDAALADLDRAIALDPRNADAYRHRANVHRRKGDLDRALADFAEALRLKPGDANLHADRALAWLARVDYGRALADNDEAIRLDPRHIVAHNNRASLLATCPDAHLRDGRAAVASATRACELTLWKSAAAVSTLAEAHAEAGDFDSALHAQDRALALLPADSPEKDAYRARLALYRGRKPYHEPPPKR
jgi:tetratricopeptide (TPR) repeat protein